MFKFAIEKPIIVSVIVLIVCLFGIVAINKIPIQMIPDLDVRSITVTTLWPGATPQDVEQEIIIEQEEYLRRIPGLERMISKATTGRAEIELEFPHGTDINELLIRVNNALSQVPGYPENVDEPRIVTSSFSNNPFIFLSTTPLPGNPKNVDMIMLQDFITDHVRTRLERVPGVSEASIWGGAKRQIKVFVDPVKLAERQITLTALRHAVRARNRDMSGGDLDSGKHRFLLRTIGRFDTIEDIENTVIAHRDGSFIRLADVGYAELSTFEVRSFSYRGGVPNITIGIRRQTGANVIEVMDAVMQKVDELNQEMMRSEGLQLTMISNDVKYVQDSISNVRRNLLLGAVLVVLVLFLFLRSVSATLTGAVGIPVCTIAAFLGLLVFGRTINVISLAGIAFAIGMTLDNSIVVLENIYRHIQQGKARMQAALDGVTEVWPAVLASTLTTVFVFLPVLFIQEEAGQLYSDIAIAISASIFISMLVAITVVPAIASRCLQPMTVRHDKGGWYAAGQRTAEGIAGFTAWLLQNTRRRLVFILLICLFSAFIFSLKPKAEYLPEGEEQKVFTMLFAPPGYNVHEMHGIYRQLEAELLPYVGEDPAKYARGESEVPGLNFVLGYAGAERNMILPEATSRKQADDLVQVISEMAAGIPGIHAFASRGSIFSSNFGGSRSINLELAGTDLVLLFATAARAFELAHQVFDNPRIRPTPSSLTMGQPMLEIRPDWERASELGLDADELGYMIWAYSDGAFLDEFFLGDDKIDMYVYSTHGTISQPDDVENILLYSPAGGVVPLGAVASIKQSVNTGTIRRVDGARTITLGIVPPKNIALEAGVETVRSGIIDALNTDQQVAAGIDMTITGANDRLIATRDSLSANFIIAILLSYLLLVAIFSHWGYPFIIMTSVPVGIAGGVAGICLLNFIGGHLPLFGFAPVHQPFDVITMLGFLVLIGTVVNNPILVVDRAVKNIKQKGMAVKAAVLESTRTRLRPVMISSITTIFGLSPLVFYPGAGTELYRGLGVIVLFGLLFSIVVTLTFVPCLLSLVLESVFGRRGAEVPPAVAEKPSL